MLRQEIQQTQETLAARDAEVDELKARVAELETLQQQQQQMIALKDSALAAAQKRLAEGGAETAQPATDPAPEGGPVWPWIVLPLVLLLAVAAWWLLRRPGARPRPRLFSGAGAAPAARPVPAAPAPPPMAPDPEPIAEPVPPPSFAKAQPEPAPEPEPEPAPEPEPVLEAEPVPPAVVDAPDTELEPVVAGESFAAETGGAPTLAGAEVQCGMVGAAIAAAALAAGREQATTPARRVELARAYLDLGDEGAARELLREVLDGRDPVARDIAARMLREL